MNDVFTSLHEVMLLFVLCGARISTALNVAPILRKGTVSTLIRNSVILSLVLAVSPMLWPSVPHGRTVGAAIPFLLIIKEVFLGFVIGWLVGIVFWAVESAGIFIDTQTGTSMASLYNPMFQSSDTPTAMLFTQTALMLFFSSGGFLLLISGLYATYQVWPVGSFTPSLDIRLATFALAQADVCMTLAFSFAAPVVLAAFFVDFGMGLINRFVPQLQVFFMAMPIKGALSAILLYMFLFVLIALLQEKFRTFQFLPSFVEGFL